MALSATQQKQIVLEYYDRFHDPRFLEWDPLSVVREYRMTPDAEWIALISAIFAFGGVKQIIKSVQSALRLLEVSPAGSAKAPWVSQFNSKESETEFALKTQKMLSGFRHRIYVEDDLLVLLLLYRRSHQRYGSLEKHFLRFHSVDSETVGDGMIGLIEEYRSWMTELPVKPGRFFAHMLNSPAQKSACKRWLMFLKWVIRADDGIDLGLWKNSTEILRTDQLVIPLDTHLFKISKKLGLTKRKVANWVTAVEVTQNLKKIDAQDPIRFDFALCRWGMFDYRKILLQTEKNTRES